jgi:hypothetical protein
VVGVKNEHPRWLLEQGADLVTPEMSKAKEHKVGQKVVEITRTVLLRKRPA